MVDISSIFVTGGAGYVGSTLINELANCGYNVRTLDSKIFCSGKN